MRKRVGGCQLPVLSLRGTKSRGNLTGGGNYSKKPKDKEEKERNGLTADSIAIVSLPEAGVEAQGVSER